MCLHPQDLQRNHSWLFPCQKTRVKWIKLLIKAALRCSSFKWSSQVGVTGKSCLWIAPLAPLDSADNFQFNLAEIQKPIHFCVKGESQLCPRTVSAILVNCDCHNNTISLGTGSYSQRCSVLENILTRIFCHEYSLIFFGTQSQRKHFQRVLHLLRKR